MTVKLSLVSTRRIRYTISIVRIRYTISIVMIRYTISIVVPSADIHTHERLGGDVADDAYAASLSFHHHTLGVEALDGRLVGVVDVGGQHGEGDVLQEVHQVGDAVVELVVAKGLREKGGG